MATTRTAGITIDRIGRRTINRSIAAYGYSYASDRSVKNMPGVVSRRRSSASSGEWSDGRMRDRCSRIAATASSRNRSTNAQRLWSTRLTELRAPICKSERRTYINTSKPTALSKSRGTKEPAWLVAIGWPTKRNACTSRLEQMKRFASSTIVRGAASLRHHRQSAQARGRSYGSPIWPTSQSPGAGDRFHSSLTDARSATVVP
jgi:hypothetical protein